MSLVKQALINKLALMDHVPGALGIQTGLIQGATRDPQKEIPGILPTVGLGMAGVGTLGFGSGLGLEHALRKLEVPAEEVAKSPYTARKLGRLGLLAGLISGLSGAIPRNILLKKRRKMMEEDQI